MEHYPSTTVTESTDVIIEIQCEDKTAAETDVSTQTNVRSAFKTKSTTMIIYFLIAAALIGGIVFGVHSAINESGSDVPRDDESTLHRDVNPCDVPSPAKGHSTESIHGTGMGASQLAGQIAEDIVRTPDASEPVAEQTSEDSSEDLESCQGEEEMYECQEELEIVD